MDLADLTPQVVAAANRAAKLSRGAFRALSAGDVSKKGVGDDVVTRIDHESEALLKEALGDILPTAGFVGEETGGTLGDGYSWVVDPLDGTRNFVNGIPFFAVSVALMKGKESVLGVVVDVMAREVYCAVKGQGAWVKGKGEKEALCVRGKNTLQGAFVATGFPHTTRHRISEFLAQFHRLFEVAGGIRRMGAAALDLAYTAAGRFDMFWEAGLNIWDIAAGALLVEEAGGKVSDLRGGDTHLETGDVLATNGKLHREAIKILRDREDQE